MATGTTSNDSEYLFRLQLLIIDGGAGVVRKIFDQKVQQYNVSLDVLLANGITVIKRLQGQKIITKPQYDQLYPPGGQLPNSADFDITLIICLLRNLPSLGLNQHYVWNVPPQQTDTSVEADLLRLKSFRNEIAHISSTTGLQQTSFQTKWAEIEQVLLRLNKHIANPIVGLKQTIYNYKTRWLDTATEQRIKTVIKQWREMETEMQQIKIDVGEMRGDIEDVKDRVRDLEEDKKEQAEAKLLTETNTTNSMQTVSQLDYSMNKESSSTHHGVGVTTGLKIQ